MIAAAAQASSPVLPYRRKIAFVVAAFAVVTGTLLAAVLLFDIYLHHRVQGVAGLNVWGYRGPIVGHKARGETRVVALGGSTVFGYGVAWNESWPYFAERRLNASRPGGPITVVNLGAPRDSVATFVVTMDDYAYLDYDVVILYEGYNDLEAPGATGDDADGGGNRGADPALGHYIAWRHQSPVFRWTGYFPIFPLVLTEKAMAMMHGGDVNAAYSSRDIVFRPGLGTRVTAGALKATADIALGLEQRFGRLTPGGPDTSEAYDASCARWSRYCGAVSEAVRLARQRGKRVLVVTQPYLSDLHVEQQRALEAMLRRQFGGDPRVRYVNLGRLIDLHDPRLAYDGLHLTAVGNEKIAAALAPVVLEVLQ
jgi:lysophospholipase L1-like esterase